MKVLVVACALLLAGCASSGPAVPSLGGRTNQPAGATGAARAAALHAAAQCIREHGIPTYQDPVLTSDGHVYTDERSIQDADRDNRDAPTLQAVQRACHDLIAAAGFAPDDEAPAPPRLVAAGVKAAQCVRANGLPNYRDPTSATPFVPGHGFSITGDQMPAGGKADPLAQQAFRACRALLDDEIRESSLGNLAHG
jgi:hypothetical protein